MTFNSITYKGTNPLDKESFRSLLDHDVNFSYPYLLVRIVQDVPYKWYTVRINRLDIQDWVIDNSDGWRFAANTTLGGFTDKGCYDLREDVYSWFILRWA